MFGFDYDYTLAEYTPSTLNFIFEKAKYYLVEKHGYPPEVLGIPYDPDFIIRGLFFDPKRGVMMKLDGYSVGFVNWYIVSDWLKSAANRNQFGNPFKLLMQMLFSKDSNEFLKWN